VSEVTLDSKGRVLIPNEIRKKTGLTAGSKLRVSASGNEIIIRKSIEPKDFIREMQGVIKKGSKVKRLDPLKLKEIWVKS
jgi:AbrB family looped-hinge helix DNA binding protein